MERVLLWLDELDDYVTLWLHHPGRVRRVSLQAGLGAALALGLVERLALADALAGVLAASAAAAVLLWAGAAAVEVAARRAAVQWRRTA